MGFIVPITNLQQYRPMKFFKSTFVGFWQLYGNTYLKEQTYVATSEKYLFNFNKSFTSIICKCLKVNGKKFICMESYRPTALANLLKKKLSAF